jgi:hypothetical protein
MFVAYSVTVSCGLEIMFGSKNMTDLIGKASVVEGGLLLLLFCVYFGLLIAKPNLFG